MSKSGEIEGLVQFVGGIVMGGLALYNISTAASNASNALNASTNNNNNNNNNNNSLNMSTANHDTPMKNAAEPTKNAVLERAKHTTESKHQPKQPTIVDDHVPSWASSKDPKVPIDEDFVKPSWMSSSMNGHSHHQHNHEVPSWASSKEPSVNIVEEIPPSWKASSSEISAPKHDSLASSKHFNTFVDDVVADEQPSWMSKRDASIKLDEFSPQWRSSKSKFEDDVPTLNLSPVLNKSAVVMNGNGHHHHHHHQPQHDDESDDERPSWMSKKEPQEPISRTSFSRSNNHSTVVSKPETKATVLVHEKVVSAAHDTLQTSNVIVSHIAAQFSDTVFVYPVLSQSFLGEILAIKKKEGAIVRNARHEIVDIKIMETRAGAGSAAFGTIAGGSQVSMLTASSALKLMLPTLHMISSRSLPVTLHVAAAAIGAEDLSLRADHTDIYMTRDSGFAILASANVQEAHDMALVSHIASAQLQLPIMHFFDGSRTLSTLSNLNAEPDSVLSDISKNHMRPRYISGNKNNNHTLAESIAQSIDEMLMKHGGHRIFEYVGPQDAETLIVCMGAPSSVMELVAGVESSSSSHHHNYRSSSHLKVGVLKVRLLRPWSSEHFLQAIPKKVRRICVLDMCSSKQSPLFQDVAAAFHSKPKLVTPLLIGGQIYPSPEGFTPEMAKSVLENMRSDTPLPHFKVCSDAQISTLRVSHASSSFMAELVEPGVHQIVSWTSTVSALSDISKALHSIGGINIRLNSSADTHAGVFRSEFMFGHAKTPAEHVQIDAGADVMVCELDSLRNADSAQLDVFSPLRDGAVLVLVTDLEDPHEVVQHSLNANTKRRIARKSLKLYIASIPVMAKKMDIEKPCETLKQWIISLLSVYCASPEIYSHAVPNLQSMLRSSAAHTLVSTHVLQQLPTHLHRVEYHHNWLDNSGHHHTAASAAATAASSSAELGRKFVSRVPLSSSTTITTTTTTNEKAATFGDAPKTSPTHEVAWSLIFKELYDTKAVLRPREHEVFQVRLTSNKRLTPDSYDRNIFHLEFDASGTNLRYEIGDALGVFGHNDEKEVDEFIAAYGLDPKEFVARPLNNGKSTKEYVSTRNLLIQHLDLFGRPGKKFYVALAQFAKEHSRYEYLWLMHIGTDDTEALKVGLAETVTYADILLKYRKAKVTIEDIAKLVPEIKPRHYSIASSMKLNPRSVHLLVVAVDWKTPSGKYRTGQCTRYLANLKSEAETGRETFVTVDIKPSILRLPPSPQQPIIMAGLGTGMAPFRAFIQERAIQREMGIKVGPIVLYFGARHRHEEYLYGEELDEYHRSGLVTKLGLAFSRDQKEKVYIQDKIREDSDLLRQYFNEDNGHFYLCGPTWPVPEVRDAIARGLNPVSAAVGVIDTEKVEKLKEEGRYVLEVY